MTTDDLLAALGRQYPATHGWIVLPQVRDATGAGAGRTCDALALNAWPSRGLELQGFELKISRGDWLRELRQPAKAESIFRYCDRWWIVAAGGAGLVEAGELFATWGLMSVTDKGRITIVRDAPKLQAQPFDRVFVAAMMRGLQACESPHAKIEQARHAGYQRGLTDGAAREASRLRTMRDFEVVAWKKRSLEALEAHAERVLTEMRRELKEVRQIPDVPPAAEDDDQEARA
jgi:hypothetical protein